MEARHYTIMGKVQGVGYRYFAQEVAVGLSIKGYAKNLLDGNVECLAIGSAEDLENFEKKIRKGPPLSRVVNMERELLNLDEVDVPGDFSVS